MASPTSFNDPTIERTCEWRKLRAEARTKGLRPDWTGIGLLVLGFACLETVLSKGEQWDWFGDPFGRVQTLLVLFVPSGIWHPELLSKVARLRGFEPETTKA